MTTQRPIITFTKHYVEMLIAMSLGMAVLGGTYAALGAAGIDVGDRNTEAPELALLAMAFAMTVPMVAWMRYRGHGWTPAFEMSAAMFVPTFAAIALLQAGLTDFDAAMALEHVVMLPAMLVAMLLRRDEYTGVRHAH